MIESLHQYVKVFSDKIPINFYSTITKKKLLLPFYHAITDSPKPHLSEIAYFRSKETFLEDIIFFKHNFQSIPIEKLNTVNKKNSFHISFDDGLAEIYSEVLPILIKEKIHATFFINTDFINNKAMFYRHKISLILYHLKNSNHDLQKLSSFLDLENNQALDCVNLIKNEQKINEIAELLKIDFENYLNEKQPYLTSKELLEIKKQGFTIGNHSKNHPNFKEISFLEQQAQINDANKYLESELNIKEFYFSFPFGDENIKNEFFDFMYKRAKIVYSFGISGLKNDQYKKHLHRIPMEENNFSAEQIVKFEYFYYILKAFIGKNTIKRGLK